MAGPHIAAQRRVADPRTRCDGVMENRVEECLAVCLKRLLKRGFQLRLARKPSRACARMTGSIPQTGEVGPDVHRQGVVRGLISTQPDCELRGWNCRRRSRLAWLGRSGLTRPGAHNSWLNRGWGQRKLGFDPIPYLRRYALTPRELMELVNLIRVL